MNLDTNFAISCSSPLGNDAFGGSIRAEPGDSLQEIGQRNGFTLESMRAANPSIGHTDLLSSGQRINLPDGRHLPRLTSGMEGTEVSLLQHRLAVAGFDPGPVDGHFGARTADAVAALQRWAGLPATGETDAATWDALLAAPANPDRTTPSTTTVQVSGLFPVIEGSVDQRIQAALDYGVYWADHGSETAYVGGDSPYRMGGIGAGDAPTQHGDQQRYLSPNGMVGFDCSGFVIAMFRQAGVDIAVHAQGTETMMAAMDRVEPQPIEIDQLQPGDLFIRAGHVAVYVGNGQVIESTPPPGFDTRGGTEAAVPGVRHSEASDFLDRDGYEVYRVPAAWFDGPGTP